MMHGREKSELAIVAMKPANKANEPTAEASTGANAAEPVERRAGAKGNAHQQSTHWTQSQARVSQALERIRQAIAVIHPRWEPYAGKPPVRFCAGGAMKIASLPLRNCHLVAGRSLIDLAATRLALRAPALRAATALTRPSRSAQRLPCGRQNVPTAKTVGPNNVVANHCVEHGDHLTHHRHDHDLRQLAGGRETVVERLEYRIPIAGAHRRHVKHLADVRTPAPDAAPSLERAALEGVGSDADQRSDLLAAHAAKLGQQRNQRAGQYCADSWHRREQAIAVDECIIGGNDLDHALVEQVDVGRRGEQCGGEKDAAAS